MKLFMSVVALVGLLVACTTTAGPDADDAAACATPEAASDAEPDEPEAEPEPSEPEPDEPEPAVRGTLEDPDAPEQARAQRLIEEVTGLKFLHSVPVYVYTPEDLEAEVQSWGDGFVPDNLLGFYKWSTKALYLVPEAAGNKRAFGLRIHEACHALQDQHWGLKELRKDVATTDAHWAMLGLIEGHAVQVMIDALIDEQPHVRFIAQAKAPEGSTDPRQYRSVYTYAQGTRFIQHLKEKGGYERVHEAFEGPPVSSEQILHPEKFTDDYDAPDTVQLDVEAIRHNLPEGWRLLSPDTLGEFETRMVFVQHEETVGDAESIAAGWGGDRVVQAYREDHKLTLWATAWDSEEDAREFAEAAKKLPDVKDVRRDNKLKPREVLVLRADAPLLPDERRALMNALRETRIARNPR